MVDKSPQLVGQTLELVGHLSGVPPVIQLKYALRSLGHSLPNAKSKTWSFRSPCCKCVFFVLVK